MSKWKTGFEAQRAAQIIEQCKHLLQEIPVAGMSPDDLAEYSRALKVLNVIDARLARLDPELFNPNNWGNLSNWLSNVQSNINAFKQNRNTAHLSGANSTLDNLLDVLRPIDAAPGVDVFKSLADANAQFQQKITEELEKVRARGADIKAQLDSLSKDITQQKSRVDENNQVIQTQKGRLDQSIADFQKQFSEAQEKRTKEFGEALRKVAEDASNQAKLFDTQNSAAAAKRKGEYETFFAEAQNKSNRHLEFLQKREEEVNKIFGAIGTTAFAGNFKSTADTEARAADVWRRIALALMTVMIGVAGFAFYWSISNKASWEDFAFRLGTVVILAVPAAYAANESSKHREREKLNRKIHLELASIDAYLVLLPDDQKNKIKASLAEKFFGTPVPQEKAEEVTQKDLLGVVSTVVNNLTKGK